MKRNDRWTRLKEALSKSDPHLGQAPEWFADKMLIFLRHFYTAAGLDPDDVQLPKREKTSRPALRALLTKGLLHFYQTKGRR
jgi:hypothetical protein